MILVNLKTYSEGWGERAVELARIVKEAGEKGGVETVVAVSALEALSVKENSGANVWLQHVEDKKAGRSTGWVSMEEAMSLGIKGSLLNHSERGLPKGTVLRTVAAKPKDFQIMVCAKTLGQIVWAAKTKPNWILYEPPELIASQNESVADRPESIKKAVELANGIPLLVGAGIKTRKDAEISRKMGAKGVGLSSAFVLSANPRGVIEELILGVNATI